MKQACSVLLVVLGLHLAYGQVPFYGGCPNVTIQEDFNLENYMGVWYEYEKYPFVFEIGRKCMYATYKIIDDDIISVVNAAIIRLSDKPSNVTGWAKVVGPGQLAVTFPRGQNSTTNRTRANYQVLGTDYTSYAVVYACNPVLRVAHTKLLWVLTREQNPPESVIKQAEEIIDANGLKKTFLLKTIQSGCTTKDGDANDGRDSIEPMTSESESTTPKPDQIEANQDNLILV